MFGVKGRDKKGIVCDVCGVGLFCIWTDQQTLQDTRLTMAICGVKWPYIKERKYLAREDSKKNRTSTLDE